jgi:hypothetical protein
MSMACAIGDFGLAGWLIERVLIFLRADYHTPAGKFDSTLESAEACRRYTHALRL